MNKQLIIANKQQVIEQAQWVRDNCIVIDTETTGLGENDTIVELAAVCPKTRNELLDTLVQPLSPMSAGAEKTHGISLQEAFSDGSNARRAILELGNARMVSGSYITAFNRQFDARMIQQTAFKSGDSETYHTAIQLTARNEFTTCIMELANRYLHEHLEWDSEQAKFKRLSLEKCLQITGIQREGIAHRALSDALAAADLLNFIAEGR